MPQIVETLRAVEGADARVIASLDSVDFAIEYVREDVEHLYSNADFEEAYSLIMGNQVSADKFKGLIGERYEAQTLFFDDIVVLVFPSARYEAVFASFDRHDEFPVNELVSRAADAEF